MTTPKAKAKDPLVATTGIDFLGTDGKAHRIEAGDQVDGADVDPKALRWMQAGGFLAKPSDDNQEGEG